MGVNFKRFSLNSQVRTAEICFVHFFLKFYKNHDNQKLNSLLIFSKCFIVIYRPFLAVGNGTQTFCRTDILPTDTLSNEHFVERTFCRTDSLPKRHFAENREILGVVTHFSKTCNSQSLCNYKITIVRSLPYISA